MLDVAFAIVLGVGTGAYNASSLRPCLDDTFLLLKQKLKPCLQKARDETVPTLQKIAANTGPLLQRCVEEARPLLAKAGDMATQAKDAAAPHVQRAATLAQQKTSELLKPTSKQNLPTN
mmetsp:Transcript_57063/g.105493  ORF Transcript_57063/g.105493 Transcript_57063/m.105493 type:complete len:119 (+) Transcript_57063:63-419(+)